MTMPDEHTLLLGEIKGKVDLMLEGQNGTNSRLDGIDNRLRTVENRAAIHGAVGGGIMAVGVSMIMKKLGL
jgi:hypothetical protein